MNQLGWLALSLLLLTATSSWFVIMGLGGRDGMDGRQAEGQRVAAT